MEPIERIRNILFDELDSFRRSNDNTTISKTRIVSNLAAQTIYAIRLELENKRLELELGKSTDEVKRWMDRDFTDIGRAGGNNE